jgi:hypothetical protein
MRFFILILLFFLSTVLYAKDYKTIKDDVDDAIDQVCELHQDADRVLINLGNKLIDRVNSRVSSILDAYQLDCLSDLLKIGNLGIPGFDDIVNLDFCQIIRSEILATGFDGINLAGMTKSEADDIKQKIILRHKEREDLFRQLEGGERE